MPAALMITAFTVGLVMATVWMVLGGGAVDAFVVYILSGQIAVVTVITGAALRSAAFEQAPRN